MNPKLFFARCEGVKPVFGVCLLLTINSFGASDPHPIADASNCRLHPSLELSLFASEPDVVSPVALTFDEVGRMYVVEMRDYPYGFGPDRKPGGTIRLLEDTNGDGKADRSVIFADHLSFPTSICPWNGGVLVTCPPEIIFLKDTDGDGRADVREVMFKGFILGVTDSNVNGLRWGLDNRIHGLNGGNGGRVVSLRKPGSVIPLRDLDFSFDPLTGDFETTFHSSRGFGIVFDEWGRSFVTYNINHIQERLIPEKYFRRFAGFPAIRGTSSISDHGDMARIFPVSIAETRPNHPEQSGYFSSAGGMGYFGWNAYGPDLHGSILVCDVVGNLVHRDVLQEQGSIYRAQRASTEQDSEFFASMDNSFRPVGLEMGPDGALYLIDMQRDVIEHPDYIPESIRSKIDLRAGDNRGRIYKLKPKGHRTSFLNLGSASVSTLVENLSDPIQWRRVTAQRLIFERQQKEAIPALKQLLISGTALARLHALWTLHGLDALEMGQLEQALSDKEPGIRENAVKLAEPFLPQSQKMLRHIVALAKDDNARVRFQTALTLGEVRSAEAFQALQSILLRDREYQWTRVAVLSSLWSGAANLLQELAFNSDQTNAQTAEIVTEISDLAAARDGEKGIAQVLRTIVQPKWSEAFQAAALKGLQTGTARHGNLPKADAETASLLEQLAKKSPVLVAPAWRLSRSLGIAQNEVQRMALDAAIQRVGDRSRTESERISDIQLLALAPFGTVKQPLFNLLNSVQPASVQQAVLPILREFNEPEVAKVLIERWRSLAPTARPAALSLLLQRQTFHGPLLDALEKGTINVGELNLDLEQRRRLLWFSSPEIKKRAAKFLGDGEYSNRKSIVGDWLAKLPPSGNAASGKTVFEQRCAQCHRVGKIGHKVGPELTNMSHRSVEDLLSNILDPNMAINPAYITYNCETIAGELETGLLETDSSEGITLLQAAEKKVVIPRTNIKRLQSSGLSLMPEGLEAGLTPGDLRDLIAFLQEKR